MDGNYVTIESLRVVVRLDFESLIDEAEAQPFVGWDFSYLGNRMVTEPLPWNYNELVVTRARRSPDLVDLDTGGGEWLGALPYHPEVTVATESYAPNVTVAARRLRTLGVNLLHLDSAPDNNVQKVPESRGQLPFRTGSLHLVCNRHSSFVAAEVSRVLALGGRFITEQVGDPSNSDFGSVLNLSLPAPPPRPWNLPIAMAQMEAAGLQVIASGEGKQVISFADVGAFAWYLKAIPWIIRGFSIQASKGRLKELHSEIKRSGPLRVRHPGFWLEAVKRHPS